uniref:Uncharacterized protein n=1 Tax=Oryza nivara TaxID=4536 RepID=A0A0E0GCA9_ORYNI
MITSQCKRSVTGSGPGRQYAGGSSQRSSSSREIRRCAAFRGSAFIHHLRAVVDCFGCGSAGAGGGSSMITVMRLDKWAGFGPIRLGRRRLEKRQSSQ